MHTRKSELFCMKNEKIMVIAKKEKQISHHVKFAFNNFCHKKNQYPSESLGNETSFTSVTY